MQFITHYNFNPYNSKFIRLAVATVMAISLGACSSATIEPERIEIKDPGPKTKTFNADFLTTWKSCLIVLGKYPLKSYDEEAGVIETDYIKGDEAWISPHKKKLVQGGYRYKLNLRVIKGKKNSKSATKVILIKQPEHQKDFFSDSEKVQSDGLEELSLLYRIERELSIESALSKVKRTQ